MAADRLQSLHHGQCRCWFFSEALAYQVASATILYLVHHILPSFFFVSRVLLGYERMNLEWQAIFVFHVMF